MTDRTFDELAQRLSHATSRRGMLKGVGALALAGVAARFRGQDQADAQTRQACSRLQQACGDAGATCCPHLACEDGACCRPAGETCYQDNDCCSGTACQAKPSGLGRVCVPSLVCKTGTDPETDAPWVVCRADPASAWVSANTGGSYHALQICQQLGYSSLGQYGGTCGNVCGYCEGDTSCSAPGAERYDGGGLVDSDAFGPVLYETVMWECLA